MICNKRDGTTFQNLHSGKYVFSVKKSFKKDRKLKKIESNDRRNNLQESAVFKNDQRIITILDSEEFIDNAVYHSGCITKYLLRF
jgi:hypothetical protein